MRSGGWRWRATGCTPTTAGGRDAGADGEEPGRAGNRPSRNPVRYPAGDTHTQRHPRRDGHHQEAAASWRAFTATAERLRLVCERVPDRSTDGNAHRRGIDPGPSPDAVPASPSAAATWPAPSSARCATRATTSRTCTARSTARTAPPKGQRMTAGRNGTAGAFRTAHESGSVCDADNTATRRCSSIRGGPGGLARRGRVARRAAAHATAVVRPSQGPDVDMVQLGEVVEPLSVLAEEAVLFVAAAMDCQRRAGRPS